MDIVSSKKEIGEGTEVVKTNIGYRFAKRTMDIICSFVGLVLLSPIFLITAIAIRAEDGGPVFYCQKRIGQGEKEFLIYKFRSMRQNAEQIHEQLREEYGNTEVSFKLQDDVRVTKAGQVIRKFNIDELPQLINILKGDMSLVGPRPLPTYEYLEEQKRYGALYKKRYSVPQGLTCFWQISNRAEVSFEDRMRLDVEYAEQQSLFVDVLLIIKTFFYTITGKAEY